MTIDGKPTDVVDLLGKPIGPTWNDHFFLGADGNGRDIMVRLLYGGRNSLLIGIAAAARDDRAGPRARPARRLLPRPRRQRDPLGDGRDLGLPGRPARRRPRHRPRTRRSASSGPITIEGDSLAIPILIIAVIYVPYLARPVRGQALALREREFVEAARAQGMGSLRIVFTEVLPNVASTLVVFLPLLVANAILLEASLSFLGAGVQAPNPSWGTMIAEGVDRIVTAPHLTIVPGVMLVLSVLSLNVFGEGVRDALDPRARVRIEH